MKSVLAAALTSFGIATAWLHPQGLNWQSVEPWLQSLGLPGYTAQDHVPVPASVDGYVQTSFAHCPQFFPGARPVVPMAYTQRELCFSSFAILHSGQTKTPVFVAQRLNRQHIQAAKGIKRTDRFYAEARLPRAERAELNDYRGSGYSRGHMAPAGDMASEQGMAQSFSLANMVPQNQIHNAGPWNKIEADTRQYVSRAAGQVYVFTGPVFERNARTIGANQVAVPSHLFKLVYDATTGRAWVHWQANQASTRAGPPISYPEFVRRTGLHLLPDLSLKGAE
ncbi:DNA/RNA non-specific endonuclease [Alcaligenes sp. Lyrl_28]|nr:DNA/RNA non-specific endonuclease [Alcaligenes ammonioxydans]WGQ36919.1 DNA/RNA non-specific endonuclease [Alcaligenes faecalis]HRK84261.1 DNA/RNA non-specific endonuclease [Alcaligenes faecalis]